jgi:NADH:ubiquinone oxidoreductase subunit C
MNNPFRTIHTKVAEVSLREQGLIHARAFANTELDLVDAREYLDAVMYLSEELPYTVVLDMTGVTYSSKEAREWLSETCSRRGLTVCTAIIAQSYASKIIANLAITVSRPSFPMQIFDDENEALRWCRKCYREYMAEAESMA